MTVSPDSGDGARMAWVSLRDTAGGIEVWTSDSSGAGGDFVDMSLVAALGWSANIIEWRISYPGEANDRVQILIDGQDVGDCFTTWETYTGQLRSRSRCRTAASHRTSTAAVLTSVQAPALATSGGDLFHMMSRPVPACFAWVRRDHRQAGRRPDGEGGGLEG